MATLVYIVLFLALTGYSSATYCICKDGVGDQSLQKAIDYACGNGADCTPILQSGACYQPNTVKDHCSYAVNSYFQKKGQVQGSCEFSGAAQQSTTAPATQTSTCVFPSSPRHSHNRHSHNGHPHNRHPHNRHPHNHYSIHNSFNHNSNDNTIHRNDTNHRNDNRDAINDIQWHQPNRDHIIQRWQWWRGALPGQLLVYLFGSDLPLVFWLFAEKLKTFLPPPLLLLLH
ncbi:hypothetical protein L484_026414 [Morus notabilis]|uniref:X8 domain-containing protein n=1 Tax=Morus notabilis TaxID=981085 RepID=W9QYT7_9ROSA|nr:hypothetical protein L484_026414 [Morus notabilis]